MSDSKNTTSTLKRRANELTIRNQAMDEAPLGITIADMKQDDEPIVGAVPASRSISVSTGCQPDGSDGSHW